MIISVRVCLNMKKQLFYFFFPFNIIGHRKISFSGDKQSSKFVLLKKKTKQNQTVLTIICHSK